MSRALIGLACVSLSLVPTTSHRDDRPAIIFVPYVTTFGGVERLILSLSKYLRNERRPHVLACFRDSLGISSYAEWPLDVQEIRPSRSFLHECWSLARYFRALQGNTSGRVLAFDLKSAHYCCLFPVPDFALHVTDPPSLLPADITKSAPSARRRWPAFLTSGARSRFQNCRAELVYRGIRRGMKKAETVFATTLAAANELQSLFDVRPQVVRLGVSRPPASARRTAPLDGHCRFLSVSRLELNKRVDWILRALGMLEARQRPLSSEFDWRLDVIGEGSEKPKLMAMTRDLGLDHRVAFHGLVPEARLDEIYGTASIFIMPAVQGYGLPALEALVRRIPVVLHKESGVSEVLGESSWAEVVDSGIEGLAQGIVRMVRSIQSGAVSRTPLPSIPTDEEWARRISQLCGWC